MDRAFQRDDRDDIFIIENVTSERFHFSVFDYKGLLRVGLIGFKPFKRLN